MYGIAEELKGLRDTLRLLIEKKNHLQEELALAYDAEKRFALQHQIKKIETDLEVLRAKAADLEAKPAQAPPQTAPTSPQATQSVGQDTPAAKKIFFSYSKYDRDLLDELLRQLSGLRRQGKIQAWSDADIQPGEEWDECIKAELHAADIIVLFLSPDFLATDYIWDVEIAAAMARHDRGEAVVIPVVARPCDWNDLPFSKLNALPSKAKPVTSYPNRDEAWLAVVQGIRRVV